MYILSVNIWFQKLMKQFFFGIDQVVYGAISSIYDLLISIARTSIFTQADIIEMGEKIYKLLAVFMIFKVTFSLITYVVNPDEFSDKNKGVSKLSMNIVISLGLLILNPYIFNMAYKLQNIILEDNSLAMLIFENSSDSEEGEETDSKADFLNTAGDDMAFITMSAFFSPNTSIDEFQNCITLKEGKKFNPACSGLEGADKNYEKITSKEGVDVSKTMAKLTDTKNGSFSLKSLQNYVVGVENRNFGLMFRQEIAVATVESHDDTLFVMDYKFIFSTVIGVVIVLLLITFCMDVALRSIKLGFLQLIAPIPILSYVDPKSGKDGMFKKWYQLCFKTYLSLFIRLLALYFAVYIISKVADMQLVDIIDGSQQTHAFIYIFVIIGALMFAKQLPKILEGLGIKLDGDGKFFLNPFKKFEESAAGGKNITGLARGAMVGTAGALSGAGIGRGLSGAWRGMTSGKGWKETGKAEAEMNRKMRQAKLDGSNFSGRLGARMSGYMGLPSSSERIESRIHGIDEDIKKLDNEMAPSKKRAEEKKLYTSAVDAMEKRAISKIENGEAGILSKTYRQKQAHIESLKARLDQDARAGKDTTLLEQQIADAENDSRNYLNDVAMRAYIDANTKGKFKETIKDENGNVVETLEYSAAEIFGTKDDGTAKDDAALTSMTKKMETIVDTYGSGHENMVKITDEGKSTKDIHGAMGRTRGEITAIENANEENENKKRIKTEEKQSLYERQRKAKADESAIK